MERILVLGIEALQLELKLLKRDLAPPGAARAAAIAQVDKLEADVRQNHRVRPDWTFDEATMSFVRPDLDVDPL